MVIIVLLLLLSLSLFALVSYSVLLICYSAIRLLSHKCGIELCVCAAMGEGGVTVTDFQAGRPL